MKKLVALLILLAAVTGIYFNTVQNDFVFDDQALIVRNPVLKDLSNPLGIITDGNKTKGMSSYRPVRFYSLMLDYAISGDSPVGYHISNMIYHALSGYLVFLILYVMMTTVPWMKLEDGREAKGILNEYIIAIFGALVFLAHPVQVDAVAYISGRRDVLMGLFFLLGFYYYLKSRYLKKPLYLLLVLLFYIIAIFTKEMAVTLPAIILAFEVIERMKSKSENLFGDFWSAVKSTLNRYKFIVLPLVAIVVLYAWYMIVIKEASHKIGWHGGNIVLNFATVAKIWMTYLRLIFFPLKLCADYKSYPLATSLFEQATIFSVGGVAVIFTLAFWMLKKNKFIAFGLFWYIITMLPVSHIIPHHELMAEHYLYLPIIGFVIILSAFMLKLSATDSFNRGAVVGVVCVVLAFYSVRVIDRNSDWLNEEVLWTKTTETDPNSHRAWFNLGNIYREKFDFPQAVKFYNKSINVTEDDRLKAKSYNSIGAILIVMNEYKVAEDQLSKANALYPDYPAVLSNLASVYIESGRYDEAIELTDRALAKVSYFFEAKLAKAVAKYKKGEKEEANQILEALLNEQPRRYAIYKVLIRIAEEEGREEDAKSYYQTYLYMNPGNTEARIKLGDKYLGEGLFELALKEYLKVLNYDPDLNKAYQRLSSCYMELKDFDNALIYFKKIVALDEKAPEPYLGLGLAHLGRGEEYARQEGSEALHNFKVSIRDAKKAFEKSLELAPNQPQAKVMKGKISQLREYLATDNYFNKSKKLVLQPEKLTDEENAEHKKEHKKE